MDKLQVRVISPTVKLFEGDASSVSSLNSSGKFDILPQHANFITLVEKSPIEIRKLDGQFIKFNFDLAIIYASSNIVKIFTNIQLLKTSQ